MEIKKTILLSILLLCAMTVCKADILRNPFAKPDAGQQLKSQLVILHYANPADLIAVIQNKNTDLLSTHGAIAVNQRLNALWIHDTAENIEKIAQFIKQVDVPLREILIEARIVTIDSSDLKNLGIKFGIKDIHSQNSSNTDAPVNINDGGILKISLSKLNPNAALDLQLSALERQGRAHLIAAPHLTTLDREVASIEAGEEIPYQEKTSSGATNVTFKKAVLSLKVTPEITVNNKIKLYLAVNQNKISSITVNGIPAIQTQELRTQVLVNNGTTIVLGGIFENNETHSTDRVPGLSRLPVIGLLFRDNQSNKLRKQLVVFVTPTILAQ